MSNKYLLERSLNAVWHPCTQMKQHEMPSLIPIARGEGIWLYDFDGKRYLDAIGSWWVNLFGHANPRINAAIRDQLDRLEHVMLAGFTHEPVVELSERLQKDYHGETLGALSFTDGALLEQRLIKIIIAPAGKHLYFMAPYIIDEPQMDLPVAGTLCALDSF